MGNLLLPHRLGLSTGWRWVSGCLRADDDAAVGDAGPIPACPILGVVAPVLEEDVADAWRVIREGVGDLSPPCIIPLIDGHRWGLEGGQGNIVG